MTVDGPTDQRPSRRRIDVLRIGVLVGACLALALSAVVVLGASPAPTSGQPAASPKASGGSVRLDDRSRFVLPRGLAGLRGLLKNGGALDGIGGRGIGRAGITITGIHGSSIDLKTDDGWTRTITLAADTKITRGGETAKVGDLRVGDRVILRQKRNDDGTYTIVAIAVPTPIVAGTVTAVGADTLTLKMRDGSSRTIKLTAATTFKLGRADAKKADIKVGSVVVVAGTEGPNDTFTATSVRVEVRPARVIGEVTARTKDTITVKQRDGTSITVRIAADTKFSVRGVASPGLTDLAVGMKVSAVGTRNADGSLSATFVAAGKPKTPAAPTSGGTQG
jgi:hypothetical protein